MTTVLLIYKSCVPRNVAVLLMGFVLYRHADMKAAEDFKGELDRCMINDIKAVPEAAMVLSPEVTLPPTPAAPVRKESVWVSDSCFCVATCFDCC